MSDMKIRGVGLLAAAACALVVLLLVSVNDGSETVRAGASVVLFVGGIGGIVLLTVDYLRHG